MLPLVAKALHSLVHLLPFLFVRNMFGLFCQIVLLARLLDEVRDLLGEHVYIIHRPICNLGSWFATCIWDFRTLPHPTRWALVRHAALLPELVVCTVAKPGQKLAKVEQRLTGLGPNLDDARTMLIELGQLQRNFVNFERANFGRPRVEVGGIRPALGRDRHTRRQSSQPQCCSMSAQVWQTSAKDWWRSSQTW